MGVFFRFWRKIMTESIFVEKPWIHGVGNKPSSRARVGQ